MPGWELIDEREKQALNAIFEESNGVMFAHGFDGLRNGRYRVREFESALCNKFGFKNALATTSGTMAQYIAMKALDIGPGDEVITQAFTFVATVETIIELGATPVIVDVDDSYNMCPKALSQAVTPKTKLVIPVHMLGNPCDMVEINKIAKKNSIKVMEDGCEAFGAKYENQWVGGFSDISIFSFDFAKTITTGEGGVIFTQDQELDRRMREFHDHGHENNPTLPRGLDSRSSYGLNLRMSELQAAVGMAQLDKLDFIISSNKERKNAFLDQILPSGNGYRFRKLHSVDELSDTIILQVESKLKLKNIVKYLNTLGPGTKNLPDAIDWHFSGTWSHMFENSAANFNYRTKWKKTETLLRSSVSIPVLCKKSVEEYREYGREIGKILSN